MYIPTGNDDIFALDATNGKKLWEYNSDIPQTNDLICCGWDNRGVGVGQGMIFSGQLDGSFVGRSSHRWWCIGVKELLLKRERPRCRGRSHHASLVDQVGPISRPRSGSTRTRRAGCRR